MITVTQQRARAEQVKVDIFQESREFADQFVRDLHQAGYPSTRMFNTSVWSPAVSSPASSDSRIATGIIKIAANEIKFEGDVDGDGNVHTVDYQLTATGNNCPCLQRSDILKSSGNSFFQRCAECPDRRHQRRSALPGLHVIGNHGARYSMSPPKSV